MQQTVQDQKCPEHAQEQLPQTTTTIVIMSSVPLEMAKYTYNMNTGVLFPFLNPDTDGLIIYWQGGYSRVMNVASYSVQDLPKTGTFETSICTNTKM